MSSESDLKRDTGVGIAVGLGAGVAIGTATGQLAIGVSRYAALCASTDRRIVCLHWIPPTDYGRRDVDGALRAVGYKIKGASTETDAEVVRSMGNDWALEAAPDPFGDNTVFYRHASSTAEIEETAQATINRFETFGDRYIVE